MEEASDWSVAAGRGVSRRTNGGRLVAVLVRLKVVSEVIALSAQLYSGGGIASELMDCLGGVENSVSGRSKGVG